MADREMTQATFDMHERPRLRLRDWLGWIGAPKRAKTVAILDPRDLSDHLKRDLGYLDGREHPHRRR